MKDEELIKLGKECLDKAKHKQNFKKAFLYFNQIKDQSVKYCHLGYFYEEKKDYKNSIECYHKSINCNENYGYALFRLGYNYQHAQTPDNKADFKKALYYYQLSAKKGEAYAYNSLGYLFERGLGCEKNLQLAFENYKQASKIGGGYPDINLGHYYKNGVVVKKDINEANKYYKKAEKYFRDRIYKPYCKYALGFMYEHGFGVEKSLDKAIKYYEEAKKENHKYAINDLASLYEMNNLSDFKTILDLYKESARLGLIDAKINLARLYQTKKSKYKEAFKLLKEVVETSGNNAACFALGRAYEIGVGTSQDIPLSIENYLKAANNGYAPSQLALINMKILFPKEFSLSGCLIKKEWYENIIKKIDLYNPITRSQLNDMADFSSIVNKAIEPLNKDIKETLKGVNKINNTLDNIFNLIQNSKNNIKKELKNAERENDYDKQESIIYQFVDDISDKIVAKNISNKNNTEIQLIKLFKKDIWNKIDSSSKKYIISAISFYDYISKSNDINEYSAVCITLSKAVELELKKRFYFDFINYLENNYPLATNKKEWPTYLIENNNKRCSEHFTLGSIKYIISPESNNKLDAYTADKDKARLIEFLKFYFYKKNVSNEIINKDLIYILNSTEKIKESYRDRSAHIEDINKNQALECIDFIIKKEKFLLKMINMFN